jgi:hypothetical protein
VDATTTRTCAAPDCSAEFIPYRADHRYCSHACRWRAWRWREHGAAQRRPLYDSALKGADLTEVRSAAVSELVYGALHGADAATMAKIAGLYLAADRRLEHPR